MQTNEIKQIIMKSGKYIGVFLVVIGLTLLLSGCSTGSQATQYPVGMKQKRVYYTGTGNSKTPPTVGYSSSRRISSPPPKNYIIPQKRKNTLYI